MNLKALALGLVLAVASSVPADAQRRGGPAASNWELLGEEKVGFGADRDVIRLSHDENFYRNKSYRRLRFVAQGGEVKMRSIRLVYLNGHVEDLPFNQTLRPGQDLDIDLRGERSYLRQIEMFYKSKFGISIGGGGIQVKQASIQVLGENVRGGGRPDPEPPRLTTPPGWQVLASEGVNLRDDRVVIKVGRREGRIGRLRLQVGGEALRISDLEVRFGNRDVQRIRVNQQVGDGATTGVLDLDGDTRFIDTVTVNLEPRRGRRATQLVLLGSERPGLPAGGGGRDQAGWIPLGEVSVGFRVDREVIRVGQSEDWFRNRAFDKLHFVAENRDVDIMRVTVTYLNGFTEEYPVGRVVRAGGDLVLDLRGSRSYIREIELLHRKNSGGRGPAIVKVYGEPSPGRFRR